MARDYTNDLSDDSDLVPKHPEHANFLVYCDESGIDGHQKYVGFGSLWLPHERRGDLTGLVNALRRDHRYNDEVKWKRVKRGNTPFYRALVQRFFETPWLAFHAIVVRKAVIDPDFHKSKEQALLKFYTHFLANKIRASARAAPNRHYYVRVDPLPSRYSKADEAQRNIIGSMLKQKLGGNALEALDTRDSKRTPGIQLADLLLGTVMAAFQKEASGAHKFEVIAEVADHLGWPDLFADTFPKERKFNVWYFHDKKLGKRELASRTVTLKHPLKPKAFPLKVPTRR